MTTRVFIILCYALHNIAAVSTHILYYIIIDAILDKFEILYKYEILLHRMLVMIFHLRLYF